jgi:hypothetical protein
LVVANLRSGRRHRALAETRPALSREGFAAAFRRRGVEPNVSELLWDELAGYYAPPLTPHPDDPMARLLDIDTEEFEFLLPRLFDGLGLPMPTRADPEELPRIETIADLALYLQFRLGAQARREG